MRERTRQAGGRPLIPVLYYHRVGPFREGSPARMTVLPDAFRRQMAHLRRRWKPVSLDEIVSGRAPAGGVAVTFDDGYADLARYAVEVLREFSIPATFFLVTGAMGGKDSWYRNEEDILDWKAVRDLARSGFTIGSHTVTHRRLTELPEDDVRRELVESRRRIEDEIGQKVCHFAYPQGKADETAARLVREAGYEAGWGTQSGWDPGFVRRRISVSARAGMFRYRLKLWKTRLGWYAAGTVPSTGSSGR